MSLGSRIIRRGKAVTFACPPAPREPLLFLYPQWPSTFSTTTSVLAYARNGRPLRLGNRCYVTSSASQGRSTKDNTFPNEHEADPSKRGRREHPPQSEVEEIGESLGKGDQAVLVLTAQSKKEAKKRPSSKPTSNLERAAKIALRSQERARDSTLQNRSVRQAYQTTRRERTESWIPDWRVILKQLVKYTPQRDVWLERAVFVSVPDGSVKKLFNDLDNNIWSIAGRFDASVTLAERSSDRNYHDKFVLSGSAISIQKTSAEVFRVAPGSRLTACPRHLPTKDAESSIVAELSSSAKTSPIQTSARFVRSQKLPKIFAMRANKVPRPAEWTTYSFDTYVNYLTTIVKRLPSYLHRLWYERNKSYHMEVVEILREVFSSPACRLSLSRSAFHKAIAFYIKTNQISDARAAFVRMEMAHIQPDQETFNILLSGAAKQEDLHVFEFILNMMLQRGVIPNGETWSKFLGANPDFRIKAYIVSAMKEKGLLYHVPTLQIVCSQLINHEIAACLDKHQSLTSFIRLMGERYGKHWLTVDSGNRVLHALATRGLISPCWDFLVEMDARHVKPNHVSINTILSSCKQATNVRGALEFMNKIPSILEFVPDEHTYDSLFEMAWRSRSYNLARVVWIYACSAVATSKRMRILVRQSLIYDAETSPTPDSDESIHLLWKRHAGAVITKSGDHFRLIMEQNPELLASGSMDTEAGGQSGLQTASRSTTKTQLRRKIVRLVDNQHQYLHRWTPTRPFVEMMLEAWGRDREWRKDLVEHKGAGLDWKVEQAIGVPLQGTPLADGAVVSEEVKSLEDNFGRSVG